MSNLVPAGLLRRSLANAGRLLMGGGAAAILSVASVALAARTLGSADWGVLALVHATALLVAAIFRFNAGPVLIRYGAEPVANGDGAALVRLLLTLILADAAGAVAAVLAAAVVAFVLLPAMAWPDPALALARWYFVTAGLLLSATPRALLRLLGRFDLAAWHRPVLPAVRLVGTAAVAAAGGGLMPVAAVWLASHAIESLFAWYWALGALRRKGLLVRPRRPLRLFAQPAGLWRALFTLNLGGTLGLLSSRALVVVLGSLLGPVAAGYFQLASQSAAALERLAEMLRRALEPELAALRQTADNERLERLLRRSTGILLLTGLPVVIVLWLAAAPVLELMAGPGFGEAAGVFRLLLLRQWLNLAAVAAPAMLVLADQPGRLLVIVATARLTQLGLLVPLVAVAGLSGAGVSALVGGVVETGWLLLAQRALLAREQTARGAQATPAANSASSAA